MTTMRPPSPATAPGLSATRAEPGLSGARAAPGRGARSEPPRPALGAAAGKPSFRQALALADAGRPAPPRAAPRFERAAPWTGEPDAHAPRALAGKAPEPTAAEPPRLEPFRVVPALLGPPERLPAPARAIDEAMRVAGELVEAMRVGRLATGEHVISLRLRRADGALGVQLIDEGGRIRVRLGGAGGALGERLREALRAEGIEAELDDDEGAA